PAVRPNPQASCKEYLMLRYCWLAPLLGVLAASPAAAQDKNPLVVIDTSMGSITVELFPEKAPVTLKNFLQYVGDKAYDNTVFHRVIKTFVIQGGGYSADGKLKDTRPPIKNEANNGLSNERGTIAMARTKDPDSATNQFYINVKDNPSLDFKGGVGKEGYCVFGRVVDGLDVVDQIRAVETDDRDMPVKPVVIKRIRVVKK